MPNVLMKCGCVAQATCQGKPVCSSHFTLTEDGKTPEDNMPDLSNRQAKCSYCGGVAESKNWERLPFFSYNKNRTIDSYHCGCRGWN